MKNIAFWVMLLLGVSINAQANEKVELLPELKKLITPKPLDPKLLENNLFVALMGATYPHGDYYDVAQKAIAESYENILKALPTDDFMPDGKMVSVIEQAYQKINAKDNWQWQGDWQVQRLQLPCDQYLHPNCIRETIKNEAKIRAYIKDNGPLIERHNDIFAKYSSIHWINLPREAMAMAPIPAFQNFMHVSDLAFAEGVIAISEGNVDAGMDLFITWQKNINQLVSQESTSGLLPLMMAVARQQILDQYINALLDSDYAPKIMHRLAELTDLQLIYSQTIRAQAFKSLYFEFIETAFGLSEIYLSMNLNPKYSLGAELNHYYTQLQEYYRLFKLDPYGTETVRFANNMCAQLLNKLIAMGCEREKDWQYLQRVDIGRNFHNMVYLKLQAMDEGVHKKNLPEFLQSHGDLMLDPITKASAEWNDEAQVLSLPLNDAQYAPVSIRNRVKKDPTIKNLQVNIQIDDH